MFQVMSDEQIQKHDGRIRELSSGSLEDRIVAVLMDSKISGQGLWEELARPKAVAICKILTDKMLP